MCVIYMDTVACLCGNFKFHIFMHNSKFSSFCPTCGNISELDSKNTLKSKDVIDQIMKAQEEDDYDEEFPKEMIR